jgi:hypothetical protein
MIAQGDYFQSQVNYTQGALRYLDQAGNAPTLFFERGNGASYGLMSDCVYAPPSQLQPSLLHPNPVSLSPTRPVAI